MKLFKSTLARICLVMILMTAAAIITDYFPAQSYPAAAASVSLSDSKKTLQIGRNERFSLELIGASTGKIKWKSSKKDIATVDSNGLVKACKAGKTTISAKYNGKTYKCTVTVKKAPKVKTVTSTDYVYLKGRDVDIFIDKNITYRNDFLESTELVMAKLEEMTGLSFEPEDKKYILNNESTNICDPFIGHDPWPDLYNMDNVTVFVLKDTDDNPFLPCCLGNAVVLNSHSAEIHNPDYGIYTLAHELTHCIMSRNGYLIKCRGDKITEGVASYWGKVFSAAMSDYFPFDDSPSINFEGRFIGTINEDTIEELFLADFSSIYDSSSTMDYCFGFNLVKYLIENYGPEKFNSFLVSLPRPVYDLNSNTDILAQYNTLKKTYGKSILKKFGKWYSKKYGSHNLKDNIYGLSDPDTVITDDDAFWALKSLNPGENFTIDKNLEIRPNHYIPVLEGTTLTVKKDLRIIMNELSSIQVYGTLKVDSPDFITFEKSGFYKDSDIPPFLMVYDTLQIGDVTFCFKNSYNSPGEITFSDGHFDIYNTGPVYINGNGAEELVRDYITFTGYRPVYINDVLFT